MYVCVFRALGGDFTVIFGSSRVSIRVTARTRRRYIAQQVAATILATYRVLHSRCVFGLVVSFDYSHANSRVFLASFTGFSSSCKGMATNAA